MTAIRREALAALARRYPDDYQRIYLSIKAGSPTAARDLHLSILDYRAEQAFRPDPEAAERDRDMPTLFDLEAG